MQKTKKCKACGRRLQPDHRNDQRQSYCSRKSCQTTRRTVRQRLRRQQAMSAPDVESGQSPQREDARRLQEASVISEADIRAENPVIIGLISMVTGTTDLKQIERTYRQLWLRGKQIMSEATDPGIRKIPVSNLLRGFEEIVRKSE